MPGTPTSQTRNQTGLTTHADTVDVGNCGYVVTYADVPPGPPRDLDNVEKGVVNAANGELIQSKTMTIEGKPGLEFSFKFPGKGTGAERVFDADNRLYQLIVIGPNVDVGAEDVQKFFNSFKLTK